MRGRRRFLFYALETPVSPSVTSPHIAMSLCFPLTNSEKVRSQLTCLICPALTPFKVRTFHLFSMFSLGSFGTVLKKCPLQRSTSGSGTPTKPFIFAKPPQPFLPRQKSCIYSDVTMKSVEKRLFFTGLICKRKQDLKKIVLLCLMVNGSNSHWRS